MRKELNYDKAADRYTGAGLTLAREKDSTTPNGNRMSGRWALRDAQGTLLDFDSNRSDLAERQGIKLKPYPASNVRHDLDPVKVTASVDKKIADHLAQRAYHAARAAENTAQYAADVASGNGHRWRGVPDTPEQIAACYDKMIADERDVYATVRVIELPKSGKRFILVYGDVRDDEVTCGTGPFESLEAAGKWFYTGGR